jgi:aminomethyltransferase
VILHIFGGPAPCGANTQAYFDDALVASLSLTGAPGFVFFVPAGWMQTWTVRLENGGAVEADAEAVQVVRLEHGRPRYGAEVTERYLAQETQVERALHFNKGCYLGQEIVERVRSRGQVHRRLMRMEIDSREAAVSGTKLTVGDNPAGEVASSVFSPGLGKVVGLAYVRTELARPGQALDSPAGPATIVGTPA